MIGVAAPYQPCEPGYPYGRQPGSYIGFLNMAKQRGCTYRWFRNFNGIKLGLVLYEQDGTVLYYARGVNE